MAGYEVVPVNITGEMPWHIELTFNKGAVDYQPRLVVRDLSRTPSLDLVAERFEASLDPIHADRQRVNHRKIRRMLRQNWCEVALEGEIVAHEHAHTTANGQTHRSVIRIPDANCEPTPIKAGFQVEHAEHLHAVGRDGVLVANDADVSKAQRFNESLDNLVVCDGI